jgi:hypothetical protein
MFCAAGRLICIYIETVEYIYYTGVDAKKDGKHTVKEFLDIMNKNFNITCSKFLPEIDYNPCKEYKKMDSESIAHNLKHNKSIFKKNRSKKMKNI